MTAFSSLYDELAIDTLTLCSRLLGDHHHAEAAATETWLQVWQRAATFTESRTPARELILTLALNISRLRLRSLDLVAMEGSSMRRGPMAARDLSDSCVL